MAVYTDLNNDIHDTKMNNYSKLQKVKREKHTTSVRNVSGQHDCAKNKTFC